MKKKTGSCAVILFLGVTGAFIHCGKCFAESGDLSFCRLSLDSLNAKVLLSVLDLNGRSVVVLCDGMQPSGEHRAVRDGEDASGRDMPGGVNSAAWKRRVTAKQSN
jgi:hypothetical protein